jgi:molybdopterin molybdotransferase
MISLNQAILKVKKATNRLKKIDIDTNLSSGYVVSKNIYSPISFPSFEQSAMDGYVIHSITKGCVFDVIGEIKAGDNAEVIKVNKGEAYRIFTGAMVPDNSLFVVRQEDVFVFGDKIKILVLPNDGANIRRVGEQINENELAIKAGTIITPAAIGYLNMLGIEKISVFSKPKITIITTGNELVQIGNELKKGQIFESNSNMLIAALNKFGFKTNKVTVRDTYQEVKEVFESIIEQNDLIIFTGGISVGDYDFVGKVLQDLNVNTIFHKVKQKPGKPLFYGEIDNKYVFGLPGNPAAVLTSFYLFVLPALENMIGRKEGFLQKYKVGLLEDYTKSRGITHLLKGLTYVDKVELLPAQSSAMLSSFVTANCIVMFEEDREKWMKGDLVDIILF